MCKWTFLVYTCVSANRFSLAHPYTSIHNVFMYMFMMLLGGPDNLWAQSIYTMRCMCMMFYQWAPQRSFYNKPTHSVQIFHPREFGDWPGCAAILWFSFHDQHVQSKTNPLKQSSFLTDVWNLGKQRQEKIDKTKTV